MNNVVCIGDSLTYGMSWSAGNPTKNLNLRLSEKYNGINFINLGLNGDDTNGVISRKSSVDTYNPFRVIVWIGINDIDHGLSYNDIINNLQTIFTYFHNKNYEVYVLTITPADNATESKNTVRTSVNNWIKNNATGINKVIDAFTIIADPNDTTKRLSLYADINTPNHINDNGYSAIVNEI